VDLGASHYAEPFDERSSLKMPINALVNIVYIVSGLFWLFHAYVLKEVGHGAQPLWRAHRQYIAVFAAASIIYAPVQFYRIVTQARIGAILDQLLTPPYFILVVVWCKFMKDQGVLHQSHARDVASPSYRNPSWILFWLSLALYFPFALFLPFGFDIYLGIHILATVFYGTRIAIALNDGSFYRYMLCAIISCVGFVVPKVFDHYILLPIPGLPELFLTGHSISKLFDVAQIFFVLCLFERGFDLVSQDGTAGNKKRP